VHRAAGFRCVRQRTDCMAPDCYSSAYSKTDDVVFAATMLFSGIATYAAMAHGPSLTGAQDVPQVNTSGTRSGSTRPPARTRAA